MMQPQMILVVQLEQILLDLDKILLTTAGRPDFVMIVLVYGVLRFRVCREAEIGALILRELLSLLQTVTAPTIIVHKSVR